MALLGVVLVSLYRLRDPERLDLDDAARTEAPGAFVRLSDGYTHYEIAGPAAGPPVVLVSTFSVPYYVWDSTFSALVAAGYRTVRYDYYGRGYSDRPDVPYAHDLYVRQLTELLDAVGMNGAVDLIGASIGASVATTVADRQPDRVRSLVYAAPSFRHSFAPSLIEETPALWHFMAAVFDEPRWADDQLADFFQPERFPDWPDRYRVQLRYRGFRRARLSDTIVNAPLEQVPEVGRVGRHARPVLLIMGKQDQTVPFASSAELVRILPRARLVAVDSSGHLPQVEQPSTVNAAILEFLRR